MDPKLIILKSSNHLTENMVMDIEPLAGASNYTHLEARHDLGMHTVNDPSPQIPYGLIARLVAGVEVASPPWGRLRFRNQYLSTTNIIGCTG
ncbi:uncharacterized protein CIMG_11772 [Coccidioides immitis RS]|uniref:Uncharacterized protein n=1 Tax=Coccidioides immitis (strain RS) TaxID=246410 RepID=A0A0D8JU07_COCIM|nr:uncharacterized protein CIMG_11772 [Coccidioides immitis RS]KJF60599.1 hypothetical protein CIMG_11772 [Coccidioides immitis RS]